MILYYLYIYFRFCHNCSCAMTAYSWFQDGESKTTYDTIIYTTKTLYDAASIAMSPGNAGGVQLFDSNLKFMQTYDNLH